MVAGSAGMSPSLVRAHMFGNPAISCLLLLILSSSARFGVLGFVPGLIHFLVFFTKVSPLFRVFALGFIYSFLSFICLLFVYFPPGGVGG